jgi:formylglycine-generating enzyme required for sulfatase activity
LVLACSVDDERTLDLAGSSDDGGAGSESPDGVSGTDGLGSGSTAGEEGDPSESGATDDAPTCTGSAGERRCKVEGGSFLLDPGGARISAKVSTFELDELEVTVGRFRQYAELSPGVPETGAGAHPAVAGSGWRGDWNGLLPLTQESLNSSLHCNYDWETWTDESGGREDYPLTCASFYVAVAFCAWSGGRLPTEAEWEYAASGGAAQRIYPWGNGEPSSELALFGAARLAPAGGHRAGMARFGQLDLAGSAWEWTLDLYERYPNSCDDCAQLQSGIERVLRGGGFVDGPEQLRTDYRHHTDPQVSLGQVGFRCAYDL